jgi:sec-independent protein translocase protein TatB
MFDLGFWELALVALVALVVIGPERLPQVLRTTGNWLGRLRGMTLTVKQELEQELYRQDIDGQDANKASFNEMKQIIDEAGSEIKAIGQELKDAGNDLVNQQTKQHSNSTKHGK